MPCCISTSLIVFKWEHREMRPRSSQDACRAIMTPLSSALASWGSTHTAADAACAAVLQKCRSQDTGDIRLMSLKSRPWPRIGGQRHSLSVFVSLSIILPCFIPSPNMFIIINDCTKCPALALHISIWHMAVISIQKTCFFF